LAPQTKVIVVTGNNDKKNALKAVNLGAYDFYQKPIDSDTIQILVSRAINLFNLEMENRHLAEVAPSMDKIIGQSEGLLAASRKAERIAQTDISTLLLGESGTGKEVFARSIHEHSLRKDKAFVAINCASIPENLLESELFGYEKGAFTGANKTTLGKIETAQDGTLFLDEIGDMPIGLQVKMLRFLQERVIERVGGRSEIPVNIRVICATHRDIPSMVADQTFREDLFYRVGEISIIIPPLRERDNDVVLLAKTFLAQYNEEFKTKLKGFSDSAIKAMKQHKWPGNIRELQNKLKSAVIMAEGTHIQAEDLSLLLHDDDPSIDTLNLREVREHAESRAIRNAFLVAEHNMSKTAELLGVTRPTLYSLIEKYHLEDVKTGC
jgi:two-component system NtrC family response regulator